MGDPWALFGECAHREAHTRFINLNLGFLGYLRVCLGGMHEVTVFTRFQISNRGVFSCYLLLD